ncbi:MAG: hypothetical protein NT039_03780 [Candidatus Berkelbacteria bacterium]|nr:hypothetical protein [Candidatus Berkelbacteria bacterium]
MPKRSNEKSTAERTVKEVALVRPERYYLGSGVLGLMCVGLFIPNTISGEVKPWQLLLLFLLQVLLFVYSYRRDRAYQKAGRVRSQGPKFQVIEDDDRR